MSTSLYDKFYKLACEYSKKFPPNKRDEFRVYGKISPNEKEYIDVYSFYEGYHEPRYEDMYMKNFAFFYYDGTTKEVPEIRWDDDDGVIQVRPSYSRPHSIDVMIDVTNKRITNEPESEKQKLYTMISSALSNETTLWKRVY